MTEALISVMLNRQEQEYILRLLREDGFLLAHYDPDSADRKCGERIIKKTERPGLHVTLREFDRNSTKDKEE